MEKLIKILNLLMVKTAKKEAVWVKEDNGFSIKLSNNSYLTINRYFENYNGNIYVVDLFNENGYKILSADTSNEDQNVIYEFADELFYAITNVYYKVNETLDGIIAELDSNQLIGDKNFQVSKPKNEASDDDDLPF